MRLLILALAVIIGACAITAADDNDYLAQPDYDYDYSEDPLFPPDLFTREALRSGAVILYMFGLVVVLILIGLLSYFLLVPSILAMTNCCSRVSSAEAAAATIAASLISAPALFTSITGVFLAKSDVGLGSAVGGAVFKLLLMAIVCAFIGRRRVNFKLTWLPLIRNCVFYIVTLVFLVLFMLDELVMQWESGLLLLLYVAFVIVAMITGRMCGRKETMTPAQDIRMTEHDLKGEPLTGQVLDPNQDETKLGADCKIYHPLIYTVSILVLAALSYLMVWWAAVIGETLGVPSTMMGLTVLALGSSLPYLMTCIIIARKGFADSCLSVALGSNIFDLTVGLALPWFLYGIFNGVNVAVSSSGMGCSISLLLLVHLAVLIAVALSGMRFNLCVGLTALVAYVAFVLVAFGFEYALYDCPI